MLIWSKRRWFFLFLGLLAPFFKILSINSRMLDTWLTRKEERKKGLLRWEFLNSNCSYNAHIHPKLLRNNSTSWRKKNTKDPSQENWYTEFLLEGKWSEIIYSELYMRHWSGTVQRNKTKTPFIFSAVYRVFSLLSVQIKHPDQLVFQSVLSIFSSVYYTPVLHC